MLALAVMAVALAVPVEQYDADQPLAKAEYEGRSLRELTLMRNVTYARAHNPFRRKWLNAWFSKQRWYAPAEAMDESLISQTARANADALGAYEAGLSAAELVARRDAVRARVKDGKGTAEDAIELRLLSVRLGGWAGEGAAPSDLNALEEPSKLDKLLKLSDLDDFSPRDLKLLRNAVFARRGRPFKTPLVQGHFKTVTWYRADPAYKDSRLTDIDKKNVQLILSLEKRLRPPKDEEAPDAFYTAA
ncbi:MAG: YARHG domain-containing protein [Archangiaceae bacterium]|nr:YARHG domain-containing protein [Archangiaceae bacterium]